jgi:hypothetical protein
MPSFEKPNEIIRKDVAKHKLFHSQLPVAFGGRGWVSKRHADMEIILF